MPLEITNTLTGNKEPFVPISKGAVGMYVCGITPYSSSHIGHARCYVVWDTLRRFLRFSGYSVTYIQNFTDVDDKIINKALEQKADPLKLSQEFIDEYFLKFDKLNVQRADEYPKVTTHIPQIIELIGKIIKNGLAYESKGDVFFEVGKFNEYGKLSKQSLDELIKGKRVEINPGKRNPADFALWKAAKQGEPSWDSPWGKGRPGWHIECSAMAAKYLGEQFDLHCGGQDLIFPHHENEIAQSEAASGKAPFAKYWMHNGFVTVKKEKMAKSVGNILNLKDMLAKYDGETIRFFLLLTHYRGPLDYSEEAVKQAKESLSSLKNAIWRIEQMKIKGYGNAGQKGSDAIKNGTEITDPTLKSIRGSFVSAMDNDLNTPEAIAAMFKLRDHAFKLMGEDGAFDGKTGAEKSALLAQTLALFHEFGGILGIFEQKKEGILSGIGEDEIKQLIDERQTAKNQKDFKRADEIRNQLKLKGILLEDNKDGSVGWKAI
ncbi:MAG: cysteine--tRNA ligase [Candidatus Micrarchaeota archaeon]